MLLGLRLLLGTLTLSLKDCLSVLVELFINFCTGVTFLITDLEGGDDDVGRVDTDGDGSGVGLLNVNSVNVDNPFLSVDLDVSMVNGAIDQEYEPG